MSQGVPWTPSTNYVLKRDWPITLSLEAGEDVGYDSTGKTWPEPPSTEVGFPLYIGHDGKVYLMTTASTGAYIGISEVPAYSGRKITIRKAGVIIFKVGTTGVDPGDLVQFQHTSGTAGDVIPWTDNDGESKLVGQAITGGTKRVSSTSYSTVQVVLKGW